MRNQNKINQLGRTRSHRSAMLSNMSASLIQHKRISTTVAKAKELRGYVEPLITKSKTDSTHSRRMVFRKLQDKEAVTELFREIAPKVATRAGGYTRIIKTGFRQGDSAEMCIIELVDFNTIYSSDTKSAAKKTRRSRRGSGGGAAKTEAKAAAPAKETVESVEEVKAEKVVTEEVKTEAVETEATEEVKAEAAEAPAPEAETTEEVKAEAAEEKPEDTPSEGETNDDNSEEDKKEG